DPVEADAVEHGPSIQELVADMNAGKVDMLVVMGGNPVFDAPVDLGFEAALDKVRLRVQLSGYRNETTDYMHWHIPAIHYLEGWSDGRSYDGKATGIQPMIMPLCEGRSTPELLAFFTDRAGASSHDLVQTYWKTQHPAADFEVWWRRSVHDGVVAENPVPLRQVAARLASPPAPPAVDPNAIEISFRPDPTIYDGSFINNAWLQETAKPLSRNTWDNVAMISPAMAMARGLNLLENNNDHQSDAQRIIEVEFQGRKVEAPYWPQPGHPDNTVTLFLGYGRRKTGRVGTGTGYDAYKIRPSSAQYVGSGAKLSVTNRYWDIAVTQGHFTMDDREPVKAATLEEFIKNPQFAHENREEEPQDEHGNPESLYPDF